MLSPANNCFRQGEAELRASEHGIVYLYLAFEANGPLRLIKAKKGRYSVLSPANNCFRQGEAERRISEHGIVYLFLAFETNWPFGQIKAKKGHTAPPEELEYTREAGVF